jgi:hypothetical protein
MELLDFVWARCLDGHRIMKREPPNARDEAEARRRGWVNMDPYPSSDYVRPNSTRYERYVPLENVLFKIFATWEATPGGMVRFCDAYGSLRNAGGDWIIEIDWMLKEQETLRHTLRLLDSGDPTELVERLERGRAGGALRLWQAKDGSLSPYLVPGSLVQAMWLQLALHAASAAKLLSCERCGSPFRVGGGTKRRSTAKYCSNACKVAAYKARQEV